MANGSDNVVSLLSSINGTLQAIAKGMAGQNGKAGEESVSKLHKGSLDASGPATASPASTSVPNIAGISGVAGVIKELDGIPSVIRKMAGLSDKVIDSFGKVLSKIFESLQPLSEFGKKNADGVKNAKLLTDTIGRLGGVMKTLALAAPLAPLALIGAVAMLPVMLTLGGIMKLLEVMHIERAMRSIRGLDKAMSGMMQLLLTAVLVAGVSILLGYLITKNKDVAMNGLIGLAAIVGVMLIVTGLTWIASKLIKDTGAISGMIDMMAVMFVSMALIGVSYLLGLFIQSKWEDILIGLTTSMTLVGLIALLAWGVSSIKSTVVKGAAGMAILEGLMLGAMGLIFAAAQLAEYAKDRWGDIFLTLAAATGIVGAIAGLAALLGMVAGYVAAGAAALFLVEGVLAGMLGIVFLTMKVADARAEKGYTWLDLIAEGAGCGALIVSLGAIAAAAIAIAVPALMAIPAIGAATALVGSVMFIMTAFYSVTKMFQAIGGADVIKDTISEDIPGILKSVTKANFTPGMNLLEIGKSALEFAALSALMATFLTTCLAMGSIAVFGQMVDSSGRISPIISFDKTTRKAVFGKPVDVGSVGRIIVSAAKSFVENCTFGFGDLERMVASAGVFTTLAAISHPIKTFIDMLTGFISDGDAGTLTPVRIDEHGNIIKGAPVNVANTATLIVSAISVFVDTLYSEENLNAWSDKANRKSRRKARRGMKRTMGALEDIISPLSELLDMMSCFSSGTDGMLHKVDVDADGNVKIGPPVDTEAISNSIVSSLNSFVSLVYNESNLSAWSKAVKNADDVFEKLSNPIKSMMDIFKSMSGDAIDPTKIDAFAKSMSNVNTDLSSASAVKAYENTDNFAKAISATTVAVKKLDDVLIKNDSRRVDAIRRIGTAFEETGSKFADAQSKFDSMLTVLEKLNDINGDSINEELRKIDGTKLKDFGATAVSRISDGKVITSGFKEAIDGMSLSLEWNGIETEDTSTNIKTIASGATVVVNAK